MDARPTLRCEEKGNRGEKLEKGERRDREGRGQGKRRVRVEKRRGREDGGAKRSVSSDDRPVGGWVNTPVPTAHRGVRDGGLHSRPEGEGGNETWDPIWRGGKGKGSGRRACAQGEGREWKG